MCVCVCVCVCVYVCVCVHVCVCVCHLTTVTGIESGVNTLYSTIKELKMSGQVQLASNLIFSFTL